MKLILNRIKTSQFLPFGVLAIFTLLFYDFYAFFHLQPQGIHFTRQTDSLSFVYTYINNGFDFFKTGNYNLSSQEGRAASEFPIFHYFHSVCISLCSSNFAVIRILNLTLVYFSLFYLHRTINYLISNPVFSACLTFLFYSSTVLVYYSFNFLPDPAALALCFIGNYFAIVALKENLFNFYVKASIFLVLAALIKPSFGIYLIAFYCASFFSFKWRKKNYFVAVSCALLLITWVLYVKFYNLKYDQYYYLTSVKPIWKLDATEIKNVFGFIWNYWYSKYYYQSTFHLFLILIVILPYFIWKSVRTSYTKLVLFTFLGILAYVLLFYIQFKEHDYYFIALIPGISIIVTYAINNLLKITANKQVRFLIAIPIVIITFLSINYSREKLMDRMSKGVDKHSIIGFRLRGVEQFIDSLGIDKRKKILILGDRSVNGGLFFLKRYGWAIPNLESENLPHFEHLLVKSDYLVITIDQYVSFHHILYPLIKPKTKHYYGGTCIVKIR